MAMDLTAGTSPNQKVRAILSQSSFVGCLRSAVTHLAKVYIINVLGMWLTVHHFWEKPSLTIALHFQRVLINQNAQLETTSPYMMDDIIVYIKMYLF